MKIVNKMQTYFSAVTILLLAFTLAVIYFLFAAYREEDFQQRQKDKIYITLRFLSEFQDIDNTILEKFGKVCSNFRSIIKRMSFFEKFEFHARSWQSLQALVCRLRVC